MITRSINGAQLRDMILAGASILEQKRTEIDALNVFPVPDGDTGTNMSLTMKSAVKEISTLTEITIPSVSAALAKGALKGARGNSGVILSQLFRGFSIALQKNDELDGVLFAAALKAGADMAYKSMMKPKEGTILTVARIIAEEANDFARSNTDFDSVLDVVLVKGKNILDKTPDMLPVLKMAGVVDAGGQGLLTIYRGFQMCLNDEEIGETNIDKEAVAENNNDIIAASSNAEDIKYGYCTELFIKHLFPTTNDTKINEFRKRLENFADCVLVIGDYDMVKVHAHSNEPNKILRYALLLGEITSVKIDNMREQNRELQNAKTSKENEIIKEYGIVAVAAGKGMEKIFMDLSVDKVIQGGQTMNPSTEDILLVINQVKANTVFILPNNSNIILAAEQTKELTEKKVIVIPSKTIPQGISAILGFNPDANAEDNTKSMTDMLTTVKTGQVTYAVRSSVFDGVSINEGDIIGIYNGKIVATGKTPEEVSKELIKLMVDEDSGLISLFYGDKVDKNNADKLKVDLADVYDSCEVEIYDGGQPIYYYIFSVE